MSYPVEQNYTHAQLAASSTAATSSGVPVYVLRGVTGYKYGPNATSQDFNYVAGQLAGWYTHFYGQTGNALIAWQKAAGQEMGPGASASDVAAATSYISTVTTGMVLNPVLTDIFGGLTTGIAGGVGDLASATDAAGTSLAGSSDTTGVGPGTGIGAVGDSPSTDAQTGTGQDSTSSGAGSKSGSGSGSAAGSAAKVAGLAGLLGATGWSGLLVRALEALAGAALILLGLEALTGQGTSGHPLRAVSTATRSFR